MREGLSALTPEDAARVLLQEAAQKPGATRRHRSLSLCSVCLLIPTNYTAGAAVVTQSSASSHPTYYRLVHISVLILTTSVLRSFIRQ